MRKSIKFFWISLPFGLLTLALIGLTVEDIVTYTGGLSGMIIYIPALAVIGTAFFAFLLPRIIIFRIRESAKYINSSEPDKVRKEQIFSYYLLGLPILFIGTLLVLLMIFFTGGF